MIATAPGQQKNQTCERTPLGGRPQATLFNRAAYTLEKKNSDRIQKIIDTRKRHTCGRNESIRLRFNQKYNVDRKRYDDVIDELSEEFHLSTRTIETALKG